MKRKFIDDLIHSSITVISAAALGLCALPAGAFPLITDVVETGGDNEATDTVTAKWTGVTFSNGISGEFLDPFTVPLFGEDAPCYVDRAHQWNGATTDLPLPAYLVGGEYIMDGNDNRDNASLQLAITVSEPAIVYLLIDNRLTDGNAADPPESGQPLEAWTGMSWVGTEGFTPVLNGLNRNADPSVPDEVGVDEGGNGTGPGGDIQNYASVYSKSVPAGTFSLFQADNASRNMYGVVIKRPPDSLNNPPQVIDLTPSNNTLFYSAGGGISFSATTISPNRIDTTNIHLSLNGADVSTNLTFGGNTTKRTASYGNLKSDTIYRGRIVVADQAGRAITNDFTFDTFNASTAIAVEAEDYNYDSGKFVDASTPNGYAALAGVAEIDYHDNNAIAAATLYRAGEFAGLAAAGDAQRQAFINAGATDYQVNNIQAGEWLNYTRTFSANTYQVYLRAAGAAGQQVRLDKITGDLATTNQTPFALGGFVIPSAPATTTYFYLPLAGAAGNPVSLTLSGATTMRLTALSASLNLQLNYLLLVPVTAAAQAPYISEASPAPNASNVAPDAAVRITIANGSTTAVPGSVVLNFNGTNVTTSATVAPVAGGLTIAYDPPGMLALSNSYPVSLVFSNNEGVSYTNLWAFTTVSSITVIPANFGTPVASGQNAGFKLKIRKAPNTDAAGAAMTLANTALRAEQQLADLLIDPDTTVAYVNEAAGPSGDGLSTSAVINFDQVPNPAGFFPGDAGFPHVDIASTPDPNNMAMEVTAYLELTAGIHRLGVRSDDGFKVTAGPVFTDTNIVLGLYEGGRGDGLPGGATEFDFQVVVSGVYPIRLIWYEGNGDSRLEFYSVDRATFKRTLINDPNTSGAIKAFMARTTQIYVPTVAITSPANNAAFTTAPTNITLTADASVVNGRITKVEFFHSSTNKIGEATSAPFSIVWSGVEAGPYTLTAKATDTNGLFAVSTPVKITVGKAIKVNFQAATAVTPEDYLPDLGDIFDDRGNGYNYGWDVDNTANARERNNASAPDKRYDTFNHLQKALPAGRYWEIEVPNGRYKVFAAAGDPSNFDSVFDLQAEGVTFVSGTPNTDVRWCEGTGIVTVSDGRLTIGNGPKASNNKVCFVDIYALPAEVIKPTLNAPARQTGGLLSISWTGGGVLQEADSIPSTNWKDVSNQTNPMDIPMSGTQKFYRVRSN